jgi:hypothetical protein
VLSKTRSPSTPNRLIRSQPSGMTPARVTGVSPTASMNSRTDFR